MSIIDGEDTNQLFSIGAQSAWNGSMYVPWIGGDDENYKAIQISLGPTSETKLWVFQDYWDPSGENAIKYLFGPNMKYTGMTKEVPGNNRGGGNRILMISLKGNGYDLQMM
jgi:hypothetical protein